MTNVKDEQIQKVRDGYAQIAEEGLACCGPDSLGGGCCGTNHKAVVMDVDELAEKIGYTKEQLQMLPEGVNMGLSCGNPAAIAALEPGMTVVDLGSGAGFDIFLAGPKVGNQGRAIGVDMTPQMISKARKNLAGYQEQTGLDNVEFRLGEIENLPLADNSVDVIISNCVINLSADKPRVFKEIQRVLKPGGYVAASDMALFKPLPDAVKEMVQALVGCVSGAVLVSEYENMMKSACFSSVKITPKPEYVETLLSFDDPLYKKIQEHLPEGTSAADYITSVDVLALKPTTPCCC